MASPVTDKPTFRDALRHGRCLIPASGFNEWKTEGKTKVPHYLRPKDGGIWAFAGLWSAWPGFEGELHTCAIIPTTPNGIVAPFHNRMPVILGPKDRERWLSPDLTNPEALLQPCPEDWTEVIRGRVPPPCPGIVFLSRCERLGIADPWDYCASPALWLWRVEVLAMRETRQDPMTSRCAWCNLIRVRGTWLSERRRACEVVYTHGICDRCTVGLLREMGQPSSIKWFLSQDSSLPEGMAGGSPFLGTWPDDS